jgi:hypothetical protein
MTSTFLLKKRFEKKDVWSFGDKSAPLGGWEDHYVRPYGECHPDYMAMPIGHPTGVKVCVRKYDGPTPEDPNKIAYENNGYHRGTVNLYDTKTDNPTQEWNPDYYSDRRVKWEGQLVHDDYLRWQPRYNGTGIRLVHAPTEGRDTGRPYYQYAYSYTPLEDPRTGARTATSKNQSVPMIKYDVTRLHQPYPQWKAEQEHMGVNQDKHDTTFFRRNT